MASGKLAKLVIENEGRTVADPPGLPRADHHDPHRGS
jgi:hypothetical protein